MNDLGFFCINRKIFEHEIFRDPERFRAWIDLIGHFARGTDNCTLKRAQFQISERKLAKRWHWSQMSVHRFLEYLRAEKMLELIRSGSGKEAPIYHVTNYEKYNMRVVTKSRDSHTVSQDDSHKSLPQQLVIKNSDSQNDSQTVSLDGCLYEETKKTNNTHQSSPEKPTYSDPFERFWLFYPRKVGKGAAYKAWLKLRPSLDLQSRILSSLETQKASAQWLKSNGDYIPHPSTWINERRWDDELIQPIKRGNMPTQPVYQG